MRVYLFSFVTLFLKEKFHAHEYDIPLDSVSSCWEPYVLSFFIWAFVSELDPKSEGNPFKVEGITDYVI